MSSINLDDPLIPYIPIRLVTNKLTFYRLNGSFTEWLPNKLYGKLFGMVNTFTPCKFITGQTSFRFLLSPMTSFLSSEFLGRWSSTSGWLRTTNSLPSSFYRLMYLELVASLKLWNYDIDAGYIVINRIFYIVFLNISNGFSMISLFLCTLTLTNRIDVLESFSL